MKQPDGFDEYDSDILIGFYLQDRKHMIMKNGAELITNAGKVRMNKIMMLGQGE